MCIVDVFRHLVGSDARCNCYLHDININDIPCLKKKKSELTFNKIFSFLQPQINITLEWRDREEEQHTVPTSSQFIF
jgi:hypothetical protein